MHILLIDDSSSTRSLLRTLINADQGGRHAISEAPSGEEALQKIDSGEIAPPDLVIVDINMAGMSGYDVCRQFRQRAGSTELRPYIIIVTANEGVEVINEGLEAGANDYMPKPVNVKILHVRLRVAERLLTHGQTGALPRAAAMLGGPAAAEPIDERVSLIASAIDSTEAPIALVEAGGQDDSFNIVYANAALTATTQFEPDQMVGKSLVELEGWTPEFIKMVFGFTSQGTALSHVPLWSTMRQEMPIYLSFYPVHGGDGVGHYLVIHHV